MSRLPFLGEWIYTETWPNFSSMLFKPLPHWVITDSFPAFYDSESMTAIGQTARLYGAVQDLSKKYNEMVEIVNKDILDFEKGMYKDHICFKKKLTDMMFEFRRYVEDYLQAQDKEIADSLAGYEERFGELETKIFNEALTPESIDAAVRFIYDAPTRALDAVLMLGNTVTENLVYEYYEDTRTLNLFFEKIVTTEGD